MSLTLWHISLLVDRKQDPIRVGYFTQSVAEKLKLRIADVYLSRDSFSHIFKEHPDLTHYDLLHIPFLLRYMGSLFRKLPNQMSLLRPTRILIRIAALLVS
jgi:hypothetical protein